MAADNPLLKPFNTPHNVPPFNEIKSEHFLPAVKAVIKKQQEDIRAIIANPEPPTFANTVEALDRSFIQVKKVENIYNAMKAANADDQMRAVTKIISPMLEGNEDEIKLNTKLFKRIEAVHKKKDQLKLTEEQRMLLKKFYGDARRDGANLSPEKQAQLKKISHRIEELKVKFGDNILEETNRFELVLEKPGIEGLPAGVVSAAAEMAQERGHKGKWVFTIHKPSLLPFLTYSPNRAHREKIFKAYINQGNNGDDLDNKQILKEILALRVKKAKMLGYPHYVQYELDDRMAKNPESIHKLLRQLWGPSLEMAKKEAKALQALIDKEGGKFKLQPWDWWYYSEKLRKAKYDLDENEIKPYLQLENVMKGAFYVANKLWGLKFVPLKDMPVYHPDVRVYEVLDGDGSLLGIMYFDYHPRASKRGGAWMNNLREQYRVDGKRVAPVITNNGNFTKPTGGRPSLLRYDEALTLFHEFGHALHGLLSQGNYIFISGTEVALDFVELPSQIMENWMGEPEVLKVFAKHYKTGEVIPQALLDKIRKASLFNKGFQRTEFIAAAFLDLDWHLFPMTDPAKVDVLKQEKIFLDKIGLIPEIVVRYRSSYFRHVFSSMYPAGYYSYIWAEVLDADAYEAFKETGNLFDPKVAKAFRTHILERGGGGEAMELYKRFRGAEPKIDPLLKRNGFK